MVSRLKITALTVLALFTLAFAGTLWYVFGYILRNVEEAETTTMEPGEIRRTAAVAMTAADECTDITVEILKRDGSAVDAAICAAFCQGLTVPQAAGIGGGFLATIYIKKQGIIETLNSREVAPLQATENMFDNGASSLEGGLAIAVPTEVKGLWELHKKYGKLPWSDIIEPVIKLAEEGFHVPHYLASVLTGREDKIRSLAGFRDLFVNPDTDKVYEEGDILQNAKLASTLRIIAAEGADAIYSNGSLAQMIVDEIQAEGGIITLDDLLRYEPKWGDSVSTKLFNGDTLHSVPLPSSGAILTFIMNILEGYRFNDQPFTWHRNDKLIYHRIVEAFKFGFGMRTRLGDETTADVEEAVEELLDVIFANDIRQKIDDEKTFNDTSHYLAKGALSLDHGTGHISILAPNGDSVSLTSTINTIMGSWVISNATGVIFNNEMDDFATDSPSNSLLSAPANKIKPGKSPMSSMTPIILLDERKDVSLVVGGAGGILIMTSLVLFLVNVLHLKQSMATAIAMKRFHHQLEPMRIRFENGYDQPDIVEYLRSKGHGSVTATPILSGFASIAAISSRNGVVQTAIDYRRGGKGTVFDPEKIEENTFLS